jgi:hypothetical protein
MISVCKGESDDARKVNSIMRLWFFPFTASITRLDGNASYLSHYFQRVT